MLTELATTASNEKGPAPRNNLAHCFSCQKNLNNIDLLLQLDYDFLDAIALLQRWLTQYQSQQARKKTP